MKSSDNCWQKIPESVYQKKSEQLYEITRNSGIIDGKSNYSLVLAIMDGFNRQYKCFDRKSFEFDQGELMNIHEKSQSLKDFRQRFIKAFPRYDLYFTKGTVVKGRDKEYVRETKVIFRSDKREFYGAFRKKSFLWYNGESDYCCDWNWKDYCSNYDVNQCVIDIVLLPNNEYAFKYCMRMVIGGHDTYDLFLTGYSCQTVPVIPMTGKDQQAKCFSMGICHHDKTRSYKSVLSEIQKMIHKTTRNYEENGHPKYFLEELITSAVSSRFPEYRIDEYTHVDLLDANTVILASGYRNRYKTEVKVISMYERNDGNWYLGI